jgi:ferredoxin
MHMLHELRVLRDQQETILQVPDGTNLREILLEHDISPYAALPNKVNCGGQGLCATCGVWVEAGEPLPAHWHDRLAARFGYPRLSCQITVNAPMTLRILTDKVIWGKRDPSRRFPKS